MGRILRWVVHNVRRIVGFYQVRDGVTALQQRVEQLEAVLARCESGAAAGRRDASGEVERLRGEWAAAHSVLLREVRAGGGQADGAAGLALMKDAASALDQIDEGINTLLRQTSSSQSVLEEITAGVRGHLVDAAVWKEELAANHSHVQSRFNGVEHVGAETAAIARQLAERIPIEDLHYYDILLQLGMKSVFPPSDVMRIETANPLANDCNDFLYPRGTRNDNTRHPRFVAACEKHFPGEKLSFLDLGCGGGGLVLDFLLKGHNAAGVDGCDYSLRAQRAEWRLLARNRLFTADIAHPFRLFTPDGSAYRVHVVSAWEFLEHIAEEDLPAVFDNVVAHSVPGAYFIGSVALYQDVDENGIEYHRTVRPKEWWEEIFRKHRCPMTADHMYDFADFCRGVGNGMHDPDYSREPGRGFHFVARTGGV